MRPLGLRLFRECSDSIEASDANGARPLCRAIHEFIPWSCIVCDGIMCVKTNLRNVLEAILFICFYRVCKVCLSVCLSVLEFGQHIS